MLIVTDWHAAPEQVRAVIEQFKKLTKEASAVAAVPEGNL